jgi:radical SAM superfamily enzyme YgiQ (UPF0313 family)
MKILLVQADRDAGKYGKILPKFFIPSLALPQLAACTPKKYEVKIVNEWYEKVDFDEDCDLVAVSAFTKDAYRAYDIADEFRQRGIKVVLGGYHPTALPIEAKQHADAVVIGEAETSWPRLLDDLEKGKLKPFYRSRKVRPEKIPSAIKRCNGFIGAIQASRGCPYRCEFCQLTGFGDNIHRKRPVKEVVDEIEAMPNKVFWFHDASLTIDPRYSKKLFKEMIKRKLRKGWVAFGNMAILSRDKEFLRLASRAGCIAWMVGVESVSQRVIEKEIGKGGNKIDRVPKMLEIIEDEGMEVWASFIFGFDNDTPATFDATFQKLEEWGLKVAEFNILTPFPKTPIFEKLRRQNRIISFDWRKYDLNHAVFLPKHMTPEELEREVRKLSRKFFSIDRVIKRALSAKSFRSKIFSLLANFAIRKFTDFDFEGGMMGYENITHNALHKAEGEFV